MAIGRITGPLLNENLQRDGVDLRFDNDLLYLSVQGRKIGIKTQSPRYELDVAGTIHGTRLIIDNTGTIALVSISSSTTGTSLITTRYGPLVIQPGGDETVTIVADTLIDGNLHVTKNITADGDVVLGDNTATDAVRFESDIKSDLVPWISTTTTLGTGTFSIVTTNTTLQSQWSLGTTSAWWLQSFVKDIYANKLDTLGTATDLQVFPDIPRLERIIEKNFTINGDIRVYGNNPLGTSPVVTNVLYVTMDGDDTNDGRAMDASRACRTVKGATLSPYYQQGTVIKVLSGTYEEDNPIVLKPYTCVIGDDLRTTFLTPKNNTVDLFHVNSGVYIAQMTFLNLRRGEVTRYAPGGAGTYTTGAFCVAFPPSLDNPIDVFHSPYIQNCTNQSGPWLIDGTMFVPNQTVQVPLVVATGTYVSSTNTLTVFVDSIASTEMLKVGMKVNGQGIRINPDIPVAEIVDIKNPDVRYQNARSLLEKNKNFLKAEIVAYINVAYPSLVYDQILCARDTGYIIDALIHDCVVGGNRDIVYAGKKYYTSNVNLLGEELEPTIDAYQYLGTIIASVLNNDPILTSPGNTQSQTFDITLTSATVIVPAVNSSINLLVDVLRNQPYYENAAALLNANRGFIQAETVGFVNQNYVGQLVDSFTYDRSKCYRDVGLVLDALTTDLQYGGNQQTISAAVQYWSGTTSTIAGEISQTIAAYTYLQDVTSAVIQNQLLVDPYVSTVTQNISSFATGTNAAAEMLAKNIKILTDIIETGPAAAPTVVNNRITATSVTGVVNALSVLNGNKSFIQHEIVNFVDTTFTQLNFNYNSTKCLRDTKLIVDSIATDLIYQSTSNSTFAGLQYWSQSTTTNNVIPGELVTTTNAFLYAKSISQDIVRGVLVPPLQGSVLQVTSTSTGNVSVANTVAGLWDVVVGILSTGTVGVTDLIQPNGLPSEVAATVAGYNLFLANKDFIKEEVIAWVDANAAPGFTYDKTTCRRDVGYVIDCIAIDLLRGGNRQSVQAGTYYYGYNSSSTVLINEIPQTTLAYKYMKFVVDKVVRGVKVTHPFQTSVAQEVQLAGATELESDELADRINLITNIIRKGPDVAGPQVPLPTTYSTLTNLTRAYNLLQANRDFIGEEVVAYVDKTFIYPYTFQYDEKTCFRDVGLIVDSLAEDLTNRSNVKSIFAGQQYWDGAVSLVEGEIKQTVGALNYAKNIALDIIANNSITNSQQTGTTASLVTQTINPLLQGGGVASTLLENNFNAITRIIELGPDYAPPSTDSTFTEFVVVLSTATIREATDDTLYFGDVTVYPVEDKNIPGDWGPNGYADRRIDLYGSGGGALVDGNAPSRRSPIQSFVFDAFTQVNQGGKGINIINKGYAQLVSVFTIFCSKGVHVESGGIASIVNSNANFGDICLQAEGYGPREFGGTIYNPPNIAYDGYTNELVTNENYPQGYFPQNASVAVFVPDPLNRPHISLLMEVVPPDQYVDYDGFTVPYRNEQGYPGFLNAISNTATLQVGSYEISGIDTQGIVVGHNIYIRDQYGYEADQNGIGTRYLSSTTYVTSMTYQTIYLSEPIQATGFELGSPNYFNIYACGNAYYTVLTSKTITPPNPIGASKILGQENETIDAINYMKFVSQQVVANEAITATYTTASSQTISGSYSMGASSSAFIGSELDIVTGVILEGPQNAPEVTTSGPIPTGANDAVALLNLNKIFIMDETVAYVDAIYSGFSYDANKCYRDTGLIVDSLAFDIAYGGSSQSTFAGLQYWSQSTNTNAIIPGEFTTTTDAITYAKNQAISIVAGYAGAGNIVSGAFNTILTILQNGTANITDAITPNGEASTNAQIINAYTTLVSSTSSIIQNTIDHISLTNPSFVYDETRCRKDLHYILDSVAFDLLHGGNRQSIQSGVYYYGYNNTTEIPNEIPQTTAAYNFIRAIATDIVTGTPISPSYQSTITQVTNLPAALEAQGSKIQANVDIITNIINNGPDVAPEKLPIPLTASANTNDLNAYNLLIANRAFIQAETIAFIDKTYGGFTYNKAKCRRDVGLLVDALVADLKSGGNFRAVEAAKTYYTREGTYHLVELEEQIRNPLLFIDGSTVNFYQRSYMSASGYVFEYVGAGTTYGALPQVGRVDPNQSKETVQLNNGRVFFTSTDQNGDFRIGPTLVISQATGVLSGRTFSKSLFAQMTPFILAVEVG